MYTQCPDCEIAFKVTADVLKQAAGKVRCGNCGNAFNALAYLSEQMPKQPVGTAVDADLPELTPEIIETDSGLPKAISAEQSAALLKTLDELAGSDIRIEDTGVEWRVLDEQDAAMPAAGDDDAGPETILENVDEFLDDNPTPVDEFLTATPDIVDSPEIFEDAGPARTYVDELRFDDNTPLPEDFDSGDESHHVPEPQPVTAAAAEEEESPEPDVEDGQADLALSEPDEWTDILGEFQDLVDEVSSPIESADEPGQPDESDEPVGDAPTDNQPMDMDTQFALQAEAMGIDLSGINEIADDLEFSESTVFEEELSATSDDESEDAVAEEEIDATSEDELEEDLDEESDAEAEDEPEEELETEPEDEPEEETELETDDEPDLEDVISRLDDDVEESDDEAAELIDEPLVESHTIEDELAELDEDLVAADEQASDDGSLDDDSGDHNIPPMTEEEHTVNMQIDQDLMALAIEDEDGFASTIVIPEKDTEKKARDEKTDLLDGESDTDNVVDDSSSAEESGFETIIMEGEFVRSELDKEKMATDAAAAQQLADLARSHEAESSGKPSSSRLGMIAAAVVLTLLFVFQIMHQSRESLATIPAFSNTVGQVYRALGQPVQPAWDVTGWRIEASNDQIEVQEGEENLTVQSRIGNNSDRAMPYPLVNISLTDRFLEPVGSQLLDPVEYLAADLDPRKLVEPGNTFNAIITIKSPSIDASGYKVDICYRQTDGQLRCAIDDFK